MMVLVVIMVAPERPGDGGNGGWGMQDTVVSGRGFTYTVSERFSVLVVIMGGGDEIGGA